ncbi:GNAT family N-acetyltransferase [Muricauda sp. MAR_2010_75]|uniref:GNAT family N-acetyltransferase n=1 Tax=Allomuricauda sp. MAR_2010_75 TaxID=1250232 RepID=UPI0005644944|nr:GNAT family N-acetyltransferase [Muricauda sp. MAR_2010_75]
MNQHIVEHLFRFWREIGRLGGFIHQGMEYDYTAPDQKSWPSKVFGLKTSGLYIDSLKDGIRAEVIPNSVGIHEDEEMGTQLLNQGFVLTSSVAAMSMDATGGNFEPETYIAQIERVDSDEKARIFADVASQSFGYPVLETTISPLHKRQSFKLFLGKLGNFYCSCGIVYLDKDKVAGIHMIGTLPEFRGRGLGKIMTKHLIQVAQKNESQQIFLVASEAGERIYSKMGFKKHGVLQSYSL